MKMLNATILLFIVLFGFTLSAQISTDRQFFSKPTNTTNSLIDEVEICRDGFQGLAYKMRINPETNGVEKMLMLVKVDNSVISFIDILSNRVHKLYKVSDMEEVRETTTLIPHLRPDKCFEVEFSSEEKERERVNICVQKSNDCKLTKYLYTKPQWVQVFKTLRNCNTILDNYYRELREREEMLRRSKLGRKLTDEELGKSELDRAMELLRLEAERRRNRSRLNGEDGENLSQSESDLIDGMLGDYRGKKRRRGRKDKRKEALESELHNITLKVNKYAELQFNRTENMSMYENFQIPSDLLDYFRKAFDCINKNTGNFINTHHPSLYKTSNSTLLTNNTLDSTQGIKTSEIKSKSDEHHDMEGFFNDHTDHNDHNDHNDQNEDNYDRGHSRHSEHQIRKHKMTHKLKNMKKNHRVHNLRHNK